jgi:formate hydrogenlyase subunit 4
LPKKSSSPKYLFDLYAVIEALRTNNNLIRDSFISGINSDLIRFPKSLSKELKDIDESIYTEFQTVKSGRVYISEGTKHYATQSILMERFGTTIFGGSPHASCFCSVAICAVEMLDLVTHERPLNDCKKNSK